MGEREREIERGEKEQKRVENGEGLDGDGKPIAYNRGPSDLARPLIPTVFLNGQKLAETRKIRGT